MKVLVQQWTTGHGAALFTLCKTKPVLGQIKELADDKSFRPVGNPVWCSTYKRVLKSLEHSSWEYCDGSIEDRNGEKFFKPAVKQKVEKKVSVFTPRYFIVINPGPLIMIRLPEKHPLWRDVLKALTPVMRSHGLRQKDISMIETQGPADESPRFLADWVKYETRLNAMYAGNASILPAFHLYDWQDGNFVRVRQGFW